MIQKIPDREGRPPREQPDEGASTEPHLHASSDPDPESAHDPTAGLTLAAIPPATDATDATLHPEPGDPRRESRQADEPLLADGSSESAADADAAGGGEGGGEGVDDDRREGAGPAVLRDASRPLPQRIEAVLFASGQALSAQRLAAVLDEPLLLVKAGLAGLRQTWAAADSAIELVEIAGGFRFMTRPAFLPDVGGLAKKARLERLSPAALETLAVVAYRQPITRADIEGVRGVAAGPLLRVLLDRDLIRIAGRSQDPGHPLLYGTTRRFLDHFGLGSLKALPDIQDLLEPT